MNRLRCGRSSDSDGRTLHIAGLGQHVGRYHLTAPNGVSIEKLAGRDRRDGQEVKVKEVLFKVGYGDDCGEMAKVLGTSVSPEQVLQSPSNVSEVL